MAVTKIHPIKSTLKKALDYIENPDKTDDKLLVSSFACSYETADIEFEMLLAQAYQKGNNLAHHLIQSFAPNEATAEQAHEIGKQLADEVLQGKYPYVLTTHIDKGHVHNHLIFCAVDMVKQRKYVSNKQSYAYIRRTSDRLCKENGLSVVKPGQSKGKSYAEWDAQRKGTSWKAKLKVAIDAAIPQAKDFDDFLRLMQAQGYEIKQGKFISFRAPGQERFTRCKTLGEAYTEEAIKERIKSRAITRRPKERKGITLRIDLENSIKAQQSAGYEKWAKLHNLKQAAMTLNFLTEHGIDTYPDLEIKVAEITAASDEAVAALKASEHRLADMAVLIKNVTTYKQLRPVALEYPNDTALTYTRTGNSSELMLSFSSEDPDAGVEELMYAGDQGESMIELVSDLQAELTSWLDAADTSSFAEQQGMSTPDVSLIYGDYTRTALYAFESILKDVEHDLNNQITWKPVEAEKADWLYSSHEETDAERGCVGHLRGDFGRSGTEFWTSWFDHSPKLNNEEFRQELQTIVDGLRNEGGLLSNFASMRKGCSYDGALGNGHYGYRAETSRYEYCLRCIPQRGDYNFYLYCYDKEAQRAHRREQKTTLNTPEPTIKPKTQEMER